jgi:hypothetical protein
VNVLMQDFKCGTFSQYEALFQALFFAEHIPLVPELSSRHRQVEL